MAVDVKQVQLRLTLEGVDWRETSIPPTVASPVIHITHPYFGQTWFSGWAAVERHCNDAWQQTYWPISVKAQ